MLAFVVRVLVLASPWTWDEFLGAAPTRCSDRLGMEWSSGGNSRAEFCGQLGPVVPFWAGEAAAAVGPVNDALEETYSSAAPFVDVAILHSSLPLRDERLKAKVCIHDGDQDLCSTSIPEIHR